MGVRAGKVFVISGPSGVGKSTLIKALFEKYGDLSFSVSHTTREPRPGEVDGVNYHFVKRADFEALAAQGGFAEWAEVHGKLYGTSLEALKEQLTEGSDVVLDIDVQGADQIVEKMPESTLRIFIAPPSVEELEQRLVKRGESRELIERRVANAKGEIARMDEYDYVVINHDLPTAISQLCAVVGKTRAAKIT